MKFTCADGLEHIWHFFLKGFRYRQCKKCGLLQRLQTVFEGNRAWISVRDVNERVWQ